MNFSVVLKILGTVMWWEAVLMIPSLIISLVDNSYDIPAFIISIIIIGIFGVLLKNINLNGQSMKKREAYTSVALCWLIISIFGALPFYLSGAAPNFVDAFFESTSGFTTTGSSIFTDVEHLPRSLLFWRSFTLWIGGMGVLVFTLTLSQSLGARSIFLMHAESTGPSPGKLVPKLSETARILYIIYTLMTVIAILMFISGGMSVFDSFIHAFGTAGTGGFSSRSLSLGYYNSDFIEWGTSILMFLFGINFTLYYFVFKGDWKHVVKSEELRLYSAIVVVSICLIYINNLPTYGYSFYESLKKSVFQVTSVITTTGYATTDINLWPMFSKSIILILMITGACAGSTTGGLKLLRVLILSKTITYEINHTIHPNSIQAVKVDGKAIDNDTIKSILIFFYLYFIIIFISMLIISLENFDFMTTFSSVVASLGNIGSGFEIVSPLGNFSEFSNLSKLTLSMCMIIGRLELIPVVTLLSSSVWKAQ